MLIVDAGFACCSHEITGPLSGKQHSRRPSTVERALPAMRQEIRPSLLLVTIVALIAAIVAPRHPATASTATTAATPVPTLDGDAAIGSVDLAGQWSFTPAGRATTSITVPGGGWYKQGFTDVS